MDFFLLGKNPRFAYVP